jgi:hypothetical protein
MSKFLLRNVWFVILLTACAPASRNAISRNTSNANSTNRHLPVSSGNGVIDTTTINLSDSLADRKPLSLLDLPTSEKGDIVLADGYYEADFKSYCLQPGTPEPSARDAYLQAPLSGYRKDIIETILRNSINKSYLEQRNIQLLLWSVVSGSNFNKLSPSVQSTARQLITPKQEFELRGGVMGAVKTLSAVFPETGLTGAHNDMVRLFEMGNSSYELYERIAVLHQPSEINRADYKKDQWYKQQGGYYVRYFPDGYQHIKIQVYVPEGSVDTSGKNSGNYLLFDPVTMMAIPANSNAQRLGIGAPIVDIIRKVIQINNGSGNPKKQPRTTKNPKTGQ